MAENEVTVAPKVNTLAKAQNDFMTNVLCDLKKMQCVYSDYGKICGLNILGEINHLLKKEGLDLFSGEIDQDSITAAVQFAMMSELNTANKEIFVNIRKEPRITDKHWDKSQGKYVATKKYIKVVECKPQYKGQVKIISHYGVGVKKVYPMWVVRANDKFTFPTHNGIKKTDPTWEQVDMTSPVVRVVVPIEFIVGKGEERDIQYFIADRDSVATNIKAQINQSLMGDKNRDKILSLIKDMTLEQLLDCKEIAGYINSTYTGISKEEMFITKLFLNATKRVNIDYGSAFVRELAEKTYDNSDVYVEKHNAREIIEERSGIVEEDVKEIGEEPKELPQCDENGEVTPESFYNAHKGDKITKGEEVSFEDMINDLDNN